MSLVVMQPGLYSLLVDAGRQRSRSLGVPVGGAADRAAWQMANALVGNSPDALALEITLAGPRLFADEDTACVVFGAPFQTTVDGEAIPPGVTFTLRARQYLTIGGTPTGVRGYLAVRGGFTGRSVLGSASGWKPIERGKVLSCEASTMAGRSLPFSNLVPQADVEILRVLPGPQADWFLDDAFYHETYTVSPASNRMGLRLMGAALAKRAGETV
jgi:5-oxoprolinase (ATP-hydrolysing) subunit C